MRERLRTVWLGARTALIHDCRRTQAERRSDEERARVPAGPATAPLSGWPARIGVIGAGAMGTALAAGLLRGSDLASRLCFADVYPAAAQLAAAETGGRPCPVAEAAAADLVCLAVKPADADAALEEIRPSLGPGAVVLSVVLGLSLDRLAAAVPEGVALVRTMPNLAVRHGAGVVVMAARGAPGRPRRAAPGAPAAAGPGARPARGALPGRDRAGRLRAGAGGRGGRGARGGGGGRRPVPSRRA